MAALLKVADRHISLFGNMKLMVKRGEFLLPILSAVLPTLAKLILETDKILLRKMYLIPADRLQVSPLMQRNREEQVKERKYQELVKKRNLDPYEEWLKMRQKIDEAEIMKKETNAFADFLRRVMRTGQTSKDSTDPNPRTHQMLRRPTQTDVTSAGVKISTLLLIPTTTIKEFKYEPPKQERVNNDEEYEDDYDSLPDPLRVQETFSRHPMSRP